MIPTIRFVRTHEAAKLPTKGTSGAVGYDVHAVGIVTIFPGETKLIQTGWKIAVQDGYEVQVRPRSGLALKNSITIVNTPGTVDPDYRGTLGVILINHGEFPFTVFEGDRIAQLVVAPVTPAAMVEVESFDDETARGENGYGSTGISG